MDLIVKLIFLIFVLCLAVETSGDDWNGNCKYYYGNGSFIDLSPLDNPERPL